jgi:hypothetical protein
MAGWTMIMAAHAKSQAEASQKRADLLKKMEAEFKTAAGSVYACKSEDRNDPGKPSCYCYTPENGRNPNRTGSQICQKLWTGVDTKATNYNSKNASTRVCVTSQGKSDASCACKQTKTCMKVGINGLKGLNVGSMSMLSSALDPVNKITSGGDAATMDPGALANMAAKTQNLRNALENSKALAGYKKTKAKNESSMIASANKAGGSMNTAGTLGSSSSGMPSNPGEAARMLEKEVESEASPTGSKSGDTITAGGGDAPKEQLEFGLTQDDLANQENQIAEVMKENLDYGGNDTNPDAKANIFEVLSQRYQRSGMKRLFEEPAAAPTAAQPATAETIQK